MKNDLHPGGVPEVLHSFGVRTARLTRSGGLATTGYYLPALRADVNDPRPLSITRRIAKHISLSFFPSVASKSRLLH